MYWCSCIDAHALMLHTLRFSFGAHASDAHASDAHASDAHASDAHAIYARAFDALTPVTAVGPSNRQHLKSFEQLSNTVVCV